MEGLLEELRTYMYNFFPEKKNEGLPLEFWKLDDDFYYEYMNYLPAVFTSKLGRLSNVVLEDLPEAVHILWPIFQLEDGYDTDAWSSLTNAGSEVVELAISGFDRIGISGEANALRAALAALDASPGDTDAAEAAYMSISREYEDDEDRRMAVINYMRENEILWESYKRT